MGGAHIPNHLLIVPKDKMHSLSHKNLPSLMLSGGRKGKSVLHFFQQSVSLELKVCDVRLALTAKKYSKHRASIRIGKGNCTVI